jgi:uncharacterized protein YjbI with pentapeptide repeats
MGHRSLTPGRVLVLRRFVLAAGLVLMASAAHASSYLDIIGIVHDPILDNGGLVHSYSGPNLLPEVVAPGAALSFANLALANLPLANLSGATLESASLEGADLESVNLSGANLYFADLTGANRASANLSGASLIGAVGLAFTYGEADYNALTDFSGTGFDPIR